MFYSGIPSLALIFPILAGDHCNFSIMGNILELSCFCFNDQE